MLFIALPVGYIAAFILDLGLCGLWLGYGTSAFCLSLLYVTVLRGMDWQKTAEDAASSEEFSQSTETIQTDDDDDFVRVYNDAEDTFNKKIYPKDDQFENAKRLNSTFRSTPIRSNANLTYSL